MNKKLFAIALAVMLLVGCIAISAAAADGVATFDALQAAVNAYSDSGATAIQLTASIGGEAALTVNKDVYLDLNGFDITCPVQVTGGTLYCMDSQTDDFTVKDAQTGALNGYGKLTNVTGNVAGVPAAAACATDSYMMIKEGSSLSFHRTKLEIHTMTLRAENVGLYYKSHFAGDELVAGNVKQFGVALSVKAEPTEDNLEDKCKCSVFTEFNAGENANSEDATSTLLKNVMKTTNAALLNHNNSKMPVYGKAYILTKDGSYLFGNLAERSLQEQVRRVAEDGFWSNLEATEPEKADAVVGMYRQYKDIMRAWNISNVESRMVLGNKTPLKDGETLKVLAITSSFGLNTTQMLYDVAVAEGYAPENVTVGRLYASGCTLEKHLAHAPDKGLYQYTKVSGDPDVVSENENQQVGKMFTVKTEGNATLLDGLLDEDWDIIFMQQGAAQAPQLDTYIDKDGNNRIDQLKAIVDQYKTNPDARFVWNMLWGYQSNSTISPFPTLFRGDQMYMYQCNIDAVMKYVVPRTDYDRIIPTGTVIQNARTSEFGDNLCRDTYHLNNYGGIMAAYGLYAVITGQELTEINIDAVTVSATNGIGGAAEITVPLTETQKAIIMESVNNALNDPFAVTESEYPYIELNSDDFTSNLSFQKDTTNAVCPACDQLVTWTALNQDNHSTIIARPALAAGQHHFYLSSDITYTAGNTDTQYSFIRFVSTGSSLCLHLNGHSLTATDNSVITIAGAKVNLMGTGIVTGNAAMTGSNVNRGTTLQMNSGSTSGIMNIYSGTYKMNTAATNTSVVSGWIQGGTINIYEDATIVGNGNHSIYLNTENTKCQQVLNIYGGSISGGDVYIDGTTSTNTKYVTDFNLLGGNVADGITVIGNATVSVGGAPVVSGAGLKLAESLTVTLNELTTGASIAVDANGAFTVANTHAADYVKYFSAVQEGFDITEQDNVLYCREV